jgi:hypothetical protein
MATEETIILKTEVDTTASDNSIRSLNAQLKDLKLQLSSLDEGSEAFKAAAAKAGQLREQIRGVNDAIENADPEKKFAPFTRTVQGLAGGFAAAQGAMALFGGESKDLEKALLKVQGAMALSQGLNTILALKNDFGDLAKLISGRVVAAFSTLRGALISTGIGALAVAVGYAISKMIELKDTNDAAAESEKNFAKETDAAKKAVADKVTELNKEIFAIKTKQTLVEANLTFAKIEKAALEEQVKLAKQRIVLNEDYNKKVLAEGLNKNTLRNIENDKELLKVLEDRLKLKGVEVEGLEITSKLIKEKTELQAKEDAEEKKRGENKSKADKDKAKALADAKAEEIRLAEEYQAAMEKADDEIVKNWDKSLDALIKSRKEGYDRQSRLDSDYYNKQKEDLNNLFANNLITKKDYDLKTIELDNAYILKKKETDDLYYVANSETNLKISENAIKTNEVIKNSDKETKDAQDKLDEAQLESKLALYSAVGQGLGSLSQLVGQETEAGKALAIAQATIDTYAGATREFGKGGILGFITGAAVIAAGLANVQKIISVKIPKSSGGGSSSPSISGPIAPPILSRTIASESGTIGNEGGGKTTEPKPLRVVVLASDITNTQNDIKTNVERSTIK